jgi:hypothetical protein
MDRVRITDIPSSKKQACFLSHEHLTDQEFEVKGGREEKYIRVVYHIIIIHHGPFNPSFPSASLPIPQKNIPKHEHEHDLVTQPHIN